MTRQTTHDRQSGSSLDARRRDSDGKIRRQGGDTRVATLRRTYGRDFAAGYRSDTKLSTLLERSGAASLTDLLHNRGDSRISDTSREILDRTTVEYRAVLKRLADR